MLRARDFVEPVGMARRFLGLAPFVQHHRRDALPDRRARGLGRLQTDAEAADLFRQPFQQPRHRRDLGSAAPVLD